MSIKKTTESAYKPFSCGEEERELPLIFHSLCVLTACLRSASWFEFWRDMQGPPESKKASPCDERVAAGARAEVTVGNAHLERDIVLRSSHGQDDFSCRLKSTCAHWIYPRPGKSRLPCSPLLVSHLQLATKEEEGFLVQAQASLQSSLQWWGSTLVYDGWLTVKAKDELLCKTKKSLMMGRNHRWREQPTDYIPKALGLLLLQGD